MGQYYPNGLSQKAGAHYLCTGKLWSSSRVLFLHATDGSDSYVGSYATPYATLAAAETAISTNVGCIIVCKDGHAETMTGTQSMNDGLTILGEVSSGGTPTASLTYNSSTGAQFSGDQVQFVNMLFPVQAQSNSAEERFDFGASDHIRMVDCIIQTDSKDASVSSIFNNTSAANGYSLERCTFISTATTAATQQSAGTWCTVQNGRLVDCVFDMGPVGPVGTPVQLSTVDTRAENLSLLNGACAFVATTSFLTLSESSWAGRLQGSNIIESGPVNSNGSDTFIRQKVYTDAGEVYYVDSANGLDTNAGTDPNAPFATLGAAVTAASAGALIVLRSGHAETLSATLTISTTDLVIVAEDDTVTITVNVSGAPGISATIQEVTFRGITFTSTSGVASTSLLTISGDGCHVHNCRFNCDTSLVAGLEAGGAYQYVTDCTFTSLPTAVAAKPQYGLYVSSPGDSGSITSVNCTFDGGTVGFSTAALGGNNIYVTRIEKVTLKNGADIVIDPDSSGYIHVESMDGDCNVEAF